MQWLFWATHALPHPVMTEGAGRRPRVWMGSQSRVPSLRYANRLCSLVQTVHCWLEPGTDTVTSAPLISRRPLQPNAKWPAEPLSEDLYESYWPCSHVRFYFLSLGKSLCTKNHWVSVCTFSQKNFKSLLQKMWGLTSGIRNLKDVQKHREEWITNDEHDKESRTAEAFDEPWLAKMVKRTFKTLFRQKKVRMGANQCPTGELEHGVGCHFFL